MDFEYVRNKASVVCLNSGRCAEGHFLDATKIVPHNRFPGKKKECELCGFDGYAPGDGKGTYTQ